VSQKGYMFYHLHCLAPAYQLLYQIRSGKRTRNETLTDFSQDLELISKQIIPDDNTNKRVLNIGNLNYNQQTQIINCYSLLSGLDFHDLMSLVSHDFRLGSQILMVIL
jgi:hypothetical protein